MEQPDPGLDSLADLDGESFAVGSRGDYVVRFVVKRVPPTPERPHGLSYSLTLHDGAGLRLVGFDNAHAAPVRKRHGGRMPTDHRHRGQMVRPYPYRDAVGLLTDFWTEVYAALSERGELP